MSAGYGRDFCSGNQKIKKTRNLIWQTVELCYSTPLSLFTFKSDSTTINTVKSRKYLAIKFHQLISGLRKSAAGVCRNKKYPVSGIV